MVQMNPVSLVVPEVTTFPKPNTAQALPSALKLHPYMQPIFSMHQQRRIKATSIASRPSCNNAFLSGKTELRSNPHQFVNYFLQPSLIQTNPPRTTLPEFLGQASNFPQPTTYFDISPETSYSLPDDRRAETSQQLRLYEPNCGYNDLHHHPSHSQKPNLSSAMTHICSENNKQPTNRQDAFTETSIFTTSNSSPKQQIAQSKQQGCKAHRLHLLFRNPIT